jgi:hypothetical protein
MKPNEDTRNLLNLITDTMVIISTYQNKVMAPQHNRGYLDATAETYKDDAVSNMMHFFKMQLFQAALPHKLRSLVTQKDHTRIML